MPKRRRAQVVETATARVKRWPAAAGVIVAEVVSKYGLSRRWLVRARADNGNERILSRHRRPTAAWRAAGGAP